VPGPPAHIPIVSPKQGTEIGSKPSQTGEETRPATPETSDHSVGSKTGSQDVERDAVTTGSKNPANIDLLDLNALKEILFWRPVKFNRNLDYPKVVPDGFYFKQDSGGFALKKQDTGRWYGHFTRRTVKELEKTYGKKNPRTRRGGSQGTAQGGSRRGADR
jgi:hypothetical protein